MFATQSTGTDARGSKLDALAAKTLPTGSYLDNGAATFNAAARLASDETVTCSFVNAAGDEVASSRRSATLTAEASGDQITIPLGALLSDLPPGKLSIECKATPLGASSYTGARGTSARAAASAQTSGNAQLTAQQTESAAQGIDVSNVHPQRRLGSV